ncbi:hypothetical protein ACLKMW_22885 [Pseudaminobacter sp. NGMCC 1.201702]|uniref:hypothetical protein n=1 Tax=Pseudaminobacter sp. NGMCC 1.201702 TaxID=3391825 RepID=UPI0039EE0871
MRARRGGRANVRQALYMPALVALRFDPDLKAKLRPAQNGRQSFKDRHHAIMRKLIVLANALLRDGRKWSQFLP